MSSPASPTETITSPAPPPAMAFSADNCTLVRTMAILGERWTVVVLREVFLGIRRFGDIRRHAGVPRQVLTNRLGVLVEHGILRKVPYRVAGERTRHEYRLTAQGLDLQPVLLAIATWGDRYLAGPEGAPVEFVHRDCDEPVRVELHCAGGHRVEEPREIGSRPGPGVRPFEEGRQARERASR